MRCPNCKKTEWKPWKGMETLMGVELEVHGDRCVACGEILFDAEEVRRHDRAVADAMVERGIRSGKELRWVRKIAGMRGRELAEVLGVTQDTVSRWETGKIPVPATVAYVVAELYEHPRRTRKRLEAIVRKAS